MITIPLVLLAALSISAGFLNAPPLGENWERLKKWVEPSPAAVELETAASIAGGGPGEGLPGLMVQAGSKEACGFAEPAADTVCFFPAVSHAPFSWAKAGIATLVVFVAYAVSWYVTAGIHGARAFALRGLTERNRLAGAGYRFLRNKYYLDTIYERGIVRAVAHPIAKAAYWINQHVLDAIVNGVGRSGRSTGQWVYRNIDQRVVDGAVDGSGAVARGAGGALAPIQSGKVNQYGALLFGAAAVGALVLVLVNT